jgi:ferric-dicitrate binding protein FerR (iron transport regulator)
MTLYTYPRAEALLAKMEAGQCSSAEEALLESWYNQLQNESGEALSVAEAIQYRQQFLHTFHSSQLPQPVIGYRKSFPWAAAACVLLLAGLGAAWLWLFNPQNRQVPGTKVFAITNATNHIRRIVLTDSSVVWLNARSSLSWKEDFNQQQRAVVLTGEGYFEVHADAKRPFKIHTRDMNVQVLGTAFNVEAYAKEKATRVSLASGSVKVQATKDSSIGALLQPGHAALFSGELTTIAIHKTDAAKAAAWKGGGFAATDISVEDAVMRLCERYGYSIHWLNTKNNRKNISVAFEQAGFEQVLNNLCYMTHTQYRITGKQVTIY